MAFGALQDRLVPHARYALLFADGLWRSVTYSEYQQLRGSRAPRFGILDVMVAGLFVSYIGANGEMNGIRFFARPKIVQRGN